MFPRTSKLSCVTDEVRRFSDPDSPDFVLSDFCKWLPYFVLHSLERQSYRDLSVTYHYRCFWTTSLAGSVLLDLFEEPVFLISLSRSVFYNLTISLRVVLTNRKKPPFLSVSISLLYVFWPAFLFTHYFLPRSQRVRRVALCSAVVLCSILLFFSLGCHV